MAKKESTVLLGAKICPVCGSRNLKWLTAGSYTTKYSCPECGYLGNLFLVDKEALPKALRARFKKQGAAYIKWDKKKKSAAKRRKAALKGWKKREKRSDFFG